jgi:hypothetical protein
VPSVFESKTWQVQQSFLSPADEAMYGLGQHQEGIFGRSRSPGSIEPGEHKHFDSVCAVE